MDEQSQNAHDELTDQDQFRMSHHMYHLPPRKRRLYKRSVASSRAMRMRGLPPTEYWQRQRISMRRRYYSTFCRIWQDKRAAPKGGILQSSPTAMPASPIPFVPSGHFPLIRGIGLSQGGLLVRENSPPCERGDTAEGGGGIPFPRTPCLPPWGRCPRRGRRGFPRQKRNPPAGDWGLTFFHIMLYWR